MFWLLLLLWIVLNGRLDTEIILLGIPLSALITLFACRFMGYSAKQGFVLLRKLPNLVRYGVLLLLEIIKANRDVMRLILSPRYEPEPQLIAVRIPLKTEWGRVLLANSITLTPGTITVALDGSHYLIHCLDKELGEGIEDSSFVKRIKELEQDHG